MKCSNCYDAVAKMLDEKIKIIDAMKKTAEEANSRAVADHKEITALKETIKSMNTNQANHDAFVKWHKSKYRNMDYTFDGNGFKHPRMELDFEIWQAATKASEQRITELQAHVNQLREALTQLTALKFSTASHIQKLEAVDKIVNKALKANHG